MQAIGRTRWAIAEGYIPGASTGPAPAMTSHETVCILNTSDTDALFANGARLLLEPLGLRGRWRNEDVLRRIVVITLATAAPIGLFLLIGQPVSLLKIAGAIEAAHIPIVVVLVLLLNRRLLPDDLCPSAASVIVTGAAGLFFAVFAALYIAGLL